MSQIYEMKVKIEEKIKAGGLDEAVVKGKIGLRTGKVMAFITPSTPDDAAVIAKFKQAAMEILNIAL